MLYDSHDLNRFRLRAHADDQRLTHSASLWPHLASHEFVDENDGGTLTREIARLETTPLQ